jgi:hypothetical protein
MSLLDQATANAIAAACSLVHMNIGGMLQKVSPRSAVLTT